MCTLKTENMPVGGGSSSSQPARGKRLREARKILNSLPSANWVLEADHFLGKKRAKPKWNDTTVLFNNLGNCAHARR